MAINKFLHTLCEAVADANRDGVSMAEIRASLARFSHEQVTDGNIDLELANEVYEHAKEVAQ
jgi:hypothetical protein